MKSILYRTVFCMVLGLVLVAMPGTVRGDNCDTDQEMSKEKNSTEYGSPDVSHRHGDSRDRESSSHRTEGARESAGLPNSGSTVMYPKE